MMILNYQSKKAKKGSAVRVYTGDDVQLKDGVGTVIACQHKKDGLQRCLLKMLKSGKEIETTVYPRQVIYSNVDNTTYSENYQWFLHDIQEAAGSEFNQEAKKL